MDCGRAEQETGYDMQVLCYFGNIMVIDQIDLIIKQPQIMPFQEEGLADP